MMKKRTKFLCGLLLIIFILVNFKIPKAMANEIVDLDNGYVEKDNRVIILNEKGLMYLAEQVNSGNDDYSGKYVSLSCDIDLKDYTWVPIGNGDRSLNNIAFKGTFDGYNHTIKNLNVSGEEANGCYGLFGIINDALITNVIVESGNIESSVGTTGAVVACMLGDSNTVENCKVGKDVTVIGDTTGGVVGRCYGQKNYVYNCENEATVTGIKKAGGIVGITNNSAILYGHKNSGIVSNGADGTGGILGYGNANTFILDSVNTADITSSKNCGGIVGYATKNDSYVVSCTNKGNISVSGSTAGGIAGNVPGIWSFQKCINEGNVTGGNAKTSTTGGIVAGLTGGGSIIDCENKGEVVGGYYTGGVVGQINTKGLIRNCKGGTAKIETLRNCGRIIGSVNCSSTDILSGNAVHLYIDDNSGDSYEGINTVGVIAPLTGNSLLTIEQGTLKGIPVAVAQGRLFFQGGTKWDAVEDAKYKVFKAAGANAGKDNYVESMNWNVITTYDGEPITTVEVTTIANGERTYTVNGESKKEIINKLPVNWCKANLPADKLFETICYNSINDNSSILFNVDKTRELDKNEILFDSTDKSSGISIDYTNDDLTAQAKFFKKIKYDSNGGKDIETEIVYFDSLDEQDEKEITVVPEREGYVFGGWYLDEEFINKAESISVKNDVQLYAKWEKEPEKEDNEPSEEPGKEDEEPSEEPGKEDEKPSEELGKEDEKPSEELGKEDEKTSEEPGKEDDESSEKPGKEENGNSEKIEKNDEESPKTSDKIVKYITILGISVIALYITKKTNKKYNK